MAIPAKRTQKQTAPITVGIAGLGRAGFGMHTKELRLKKSRFRIVAGCDPLVANRERFRTETGCDTCESIDELLADRHIELISIATRSVDHFAHALQALKSGKHVVLDKPMCLTYDEARKLKSAAKRAKGRLFVRHNRRYDPDFVQVLDIVKSGVLGDVFEVKLSRIGYSRRHDWQTLKKYGGGQLLNWGPHIIDHGLCFLESPVKDVWADLKQVTATGNAEDHVKIVMKGRNGRVVDIEITGGGAIGAPTYLVWGSRGALSVEGKEIKMKYLNPRRKLKELDVIMNPSGYSEKDELSWVEKTVPIKARKRPDIWDGVYASVRLNKEYPITVDQAVEVMRVVSMARKGSRF